MFDLDREPAIGAAVFTAVLALMVTVGIALPHVGIIMFLVGICSLILFCVFIVTYLIFGGDL